MLIIIITYFLRTVSLVWIELVDWGWVGHAVNSELDRQWELSESKHQVQLSHHSVPSMHIWHMKMLSVLATGGTKHFVLFYFMLCSPRVLYTKTTRLLNLAITYHKGNKAQLVWSVFMLYFEYIFEITQAQNVPSVRFFFVVVLIKPSTQWYLACVLPFTLKYCYSG